jgi:tRNA-guanine family transglycosylase
MLNRRLQQGESSFGCEGRVGRQNQQALFGIIQGGKYKDLRIESAKFIGNLPFDGFGIGGEFGDDKKLMLQMINWVIKELPEKKTSPSSRYRLFERHSQNYKSRG